MSNVTATTMNHHPMLSWIPHSVVFCVRVSSQNLVPHTLSSLWLCIPGHCAFMFSPDILCQADLELMTLRPQSVL